MIDLSSNKDKNDKSDDDNDDFDDDDEEEEEERGESCDSNDKVQSAPKDIKSDDDEEMWYDTSPHDFELRPFAQGACGTPTIDVQNINELLIDGARGNIRRSGSLIRDEGFDSIPLKDSYGY